MSDNTKNASDEAESTQHLSDVKGSKKATLAINLYEPSVDGGRSSTAGPVWQLRLPTVVLSPVSEIALTFGESSITTPKTRKAKDTENEPSTSDSTEKASSLQQQNTVELCTDPDANQGIISNNFVINSAGISPATRQREQRVRGMQRRANINPQTVNFDLKCDSPEKDSNSMSEDISFYSTNARVASPEPCPISPCRIDTEMNLLSPGTSPSMFSIENTLQKPLIDRQDSSSMDSGYSGNSNRHSASSSSFKFVEPKRPEATQTSRAFSVFHSLSSGSGADSNDEEWNDDLMDMDSLDAENMPNDLSSLICKDIKSTSKTPEHKTPVRKRLNMDGSGVKSLFSSPKTSTITSLITTPERQCLQNISDNVTPFGHRNITTGAFKRPEPPTISPVQSKRYKSENDPPVMLQQQFPSRPVFRKSMSMNDASIMSALTRSSSDTNLIGDFSQPHALPLIEGRHNDLKSISAETMRKLLQGEFDDRVASYKIIDCRYPYEYEGGHIRGAMNLYMQDQILEEFSSKKTEPSTDGKRNILVFHCEFSSERGPKLSRFLRQHDRTINTLQYPALQFPEIYLLHGGYKEFFESNSDLCTPQSYRPMLEPGYTDEYKLFRAKTKSWSGDVRSTTMRLTKSRSRLVL